MAKFRKKPVVIEAVQFTGKNFDEIMEFCGGYKNDNAEFKAIKMTIHTLEGDMEALPGDWIIRGVMGEYYPCKPDIFEATYESVEENINA